MRPRTRMCVCPTDTYTRVYVYMYVSAPLQRPDLHRARTSAATVTGVVLCCSAVAKLMTGALKYFMLRSSASGTCFWLYATSTCNSAWQPCDFPQKRIQMHSTGECRGVHKRWSVTV